MVMRYNSVLKLLALMLMLATLPAHAQKYACVNTEYVLKSLPDYAAAQKRLDKYVEDWRSELESIQHDIDQMRAEYEQESYLLPDNLKKRRQEEIAEKERQLKTLIQQRFGPDGDLDKKRAELLKPVQDRIYNAIERIAHEKNYAFVFDRANNSALLFAAKKYDISDDVLTQLGYKPGAENAPPVGDEKQRRPTNSEMRPADPNTPPPLGGRSRR